MASVIFFAPLRVWNADPDLGRVVDGPTSPRKEPPSRPALLPMSSPFQRAFRCFSEMVRSLIVPNWCLSLSWPKVCNFERGSQRQDVDITLTESRYPQVQRCYSHLALMA